jgi:hypothetical protein
VHIQADPVRESVDEILTQRFAVQVFAVGVDVFIRDLVQRVRAPIAPDHGLARLESFDRRLLCAQHNVVDLALAGRELA